MNDVPQKYVTMAPWSTILMSFFVNQYYYFYQSAVYKYHISIRKIHFEELEIVVTSFIPKQACFVVGIWFGFLVSIVVSTMW